MIFKKEFSTYDDYKIYRNNIFRINLIHILLDNFDLECLRFFYEYIKDKKIYI